MNARLRQGKGAGASTARGPSSGRPAAAGARKAAFFSYYEVS